MASSARIVMTGAYADQASNGKWPTAYHLRGIMAINYSSQSNFV